MSELIQVLADVCLAFMIAMLNPANPRLARTAIMAITTRSSTRVKPRRLEEIEGVCVIVLVSIRSIVGGE